MAGKHELEKFEYLFVDIEWNQIPGCLLYTSDAADEL